MNDISWDFYRTFLAVLRLGSLSAAARELGLTQPTVGRHIDALEQAVGYQLFTRSQQGLLPTDPALALKPYAENLAATTAAMQRLASGEFGAIRGTVRISASDVVGVEVLPPILAALQDEHPGLELELSLSDSLEDLLKREADIAVRMTSPAQEALVARHIGDIPLGLYAHRRYLERHGPPENAEGLLTHRLIGFDRRSAFVRAAADRIRTSAPAFPDLERVRWSYRADSNLAQLAAIRAGAGIGICQVGIARRDPDLVRVLPDIFQLPLDTWVAMHENLKSSPRWRVTFDALVKGLLKYARN
ncbi:MULTISPECIES: LysR family transcriptional regulator [Rhizobium/Agrobacterium group]|uniref:LysR family transcriptional regulator n=1 Tax=Neorhizobium petrolearium TaxID=515361 RepID=A0ABY8M8A2_9HYPH|nr:MULTISPECIES: LysR family transcriptional regulator [Rhizobium/Agrobacterium group]KGE01056.1 LysR family transcriptional regulator [Rhizobium sp. YS-1r]MCC2610634.1 LysR family transcriptional regulator [Neorhizobium petrolearium]WGI70768.1 LysR family transcriptional regulator [Neorhizobium petrolearium]